MITPDSPVATVLGDTKKRGKVQSLGIATVGDLLLHFPRRYLPRGALTRVGQLKPGQQLTVVGRIEKSKLNTYTDRRTGRTAYRLDVLLRTDGPFLKMSFFAKHANTAHWHERRLPVGDEGVFTGQVSRFRDEWQLTNPDIVMFNASDDDAESARAALGRLKSLFPLYPATKGVTSWEIARAVNFALDVVDGVTDLVPDRVRKEHGLPATTAALAAIHATDSFAEAE